MEKIKLAVIGDPISHSLSPKMHGEWIEETGINAEYKAVRVTKDNLREFIELLANNGYRGINITVPHKEEAYKIVKEIGEIDDIAAKIEAINTIIVEKNGKLIGTNSDAYGFINSVYEEVGEDFSFKDKNILLIGAGGAAKAIIAGLNAESVAKIIIANRTLERAENIAKNYQVPCETIKLADISQYLNQVDVVINSSSLGLNGENNLEIDFSKAETNKLLCIDIVYKPLHTKFLKDAAKHDHEIITGTGMLKHQGAISFKFWTGIYPL